jgi:hypothetical protein
VGDEAMKLFVELGSAHFDTLHESHSALGWGGVTVDARADLLDLLPNRPNIMKRCGVVVAEDVPEETMRTFYYVPHALVIERGFPQWLDGCGSTHRDHAILRLFSDHAVKWVQVPALSVSSIFRGIVPDRVKIDLEGDDFAIVSKMLDLSIVPPTLEFERAHMTSVQWNSLAERLCLHYGKPDTLGDSVQFRLP